LIGETGSGKSTLSMIAAGALQPTSSLDPSVQAKVLKLLLHLQTELGLAMLFVIHDLALARKISDHVGVLAECGPASQVLERPAHSYTQFLISSARGGGKLNGLAVVEDASRRGTDGCGFPKGDRTASRLT
jgi:peptide/nickel transport system ATP-binding protein